MILTHCALVVPDGDIDLGEQRQPAIIWTNVD